MNNESKFVNFDQKKTKLMHPKLLLTLVFSFFLFQNGFSQVTVPNSLQNMSFDELKNGFYSNFGINSLANKYAEAHLKKAKREKDIIKIADGYMFKSHTSNFDDAIKYSDSIIELTLNIDHKAYPALGYMTKGYHYYQNGKEEEALAEYLKADKYARKNNHLTQQIEIKQFIASVKRNFGHNKEEQSILEDNLKFIKEQTNFKKEYREDYIIALDNLSKSYIKGKKLDSAKVIINEAIDFTLKVKDSTMYYSFLLGSGTLSFYQNKLKMALDSLKKVEPYINDGSLANCYYYQGKIHQNSDITKTVSFFNKVDSIYRHTNDPFIELKDVYKTLYDYHSSQNDIEKKIEAVDKLIKADSVLNKTIKNINTQVVNDYEIPKLKSKKLRLINQINSEKRTKENITFLLIGISLITFVSFGINFSNNKKHKRRFKALMDRIDYKNEDHSIKVQKNNNKAMEISEEIVERILDQLRSFESNLEFLKKDLTLNKLAKTFNTNSVYLSKIINHHKGQSFSKYLNELRLEYCLKELNSNKKLRSYTIKAISAEVGYSNPESFSNAFYKKTGIKPSFYIKELNKLA